MKTNSTKNDIVNTISTAAALITGLITGAFLVLAFTNTCRDNLPSNLLYLSSIRNQNTTATSIQLEAILHYATSKVVPQQNIDEIRLSYDVLRKLAPCNFLVFGLGYDSLMWAGLNPNGTTLFLEESPEWVQTVLKDAPFLKAQTVSYRTQLHEADRLLATYRDEPDCLPGKTFLKGNMKCRLALENLPEEVYEKDWDVIMIDAPRGYFNEAPGRMGAIYSVAVMARGRRRLGNTHVYLHDVDRKVEKEFAKEFLCMKYKVGGVGRLWHFEIPHAQDNDTFC
ncbi:hypothetical protein RND81_11G005300 [Saponaria officinalis]|uniref:Polysaccharide biosynthesis domain-containing protein n=1 Tax=Saponaria officinalis TaxID=3572 RepID=A0AAW1HG00_SAPOF